MTRHVMVRYLAASLTARAADEGARVALVLLVLDRTGSVATGGLFVAALLVPHVLAAPLLGTALDNARHPRRLLTVTFLGFAAGLLAVSALPGAVPTWVGIGCLLLSGCCGPAITGGLTGALPTLVAAAGLRRAFALDSLSYNVAGITGPAVVSVTVALAGSRIGQVLVAGLAMVGAGLVATLPVPPRRGGMGTHRQVDLTGGLRHLVSEPKLRAVTLGSCLGQVGVGALSVVVAVLATTLHEPSVAGWLLSAVALGSAVGSGLSAWRPPPARWLPMVSTTALIGTGLALGATATSSSIPVTAGLFGLAGLFAGPGATALFAARAELSPEPVRIQVFTIGAGLKVTAAAVGAVLVGGVAGWPMSAQLLLVAAGPVAGGVVGTIMVLAASKDPAAPHPSRTAQPSGAATERP